MKRVAFAVFMLLATEAAADAQDRKYAPFTEYEMPRDAEMALARSAAPDSIVVPAEELRTRLGLEGKSPDARGYRPGFRSVAPAHDGLRVVLRELDARRQ